MQYIHTTLEYQPIQGSPTIFIHPLSFSTAFFSQRLYEVSSKTNATDLLKTKRFKLESYFLQHKVSLIFR
jgi:hypothetical protein